MPSGALDGEWDFSHPQEPGEKQQVDQYVQNSIGDIPLGRPGTVDEIAKAVLFLGSDDSSFITGIELFVDGSITQI
jgi:NAD(P)-dependent dehydrogenase (short-subunit alcohol dehydrogenase family)